MASLGYIVYVLASLLNPVSFFLHGHHSRQYSDDSNTSMKEGIGEHDDQYKAALFVFGDSLFDAGNNGYYIPNVTVESDAAIAWPYGETFFHYPTGRFCDGRIVPDFIAKYAKLPMIPPYLQPGPHDYTVGCNFASAGAGVLVETDPGKISLPAQLAYFKDVRKSLQEELGGLKAERVLKDAVYLMGIGGDDYFSFYNNSPNATTSAKLESVALVVGNLSIILREMYDLGGRKFAFQNTGPLGCIPYRRQEYNTKDGCIEGLNSLANLHNAALLSVLQEFQGQLSGFKYSVFDYYNSLYDRINDPAKYGFINATDACCGTGLYRGAYCGGYNGTKPFQLCDDVGDYLWFDGSHTTEVANLPIAELLWSGTPDVTGPYNVKQLFQQVPAD